jgi:FKBP-type peptidyl-prolyl cis-trans isomerase FkpA
MKIFSWFAVLITVVCIFSACNKVNYRKTKSGVVYKLFPGNSKDSLPRNGQVIKFEVTTKMNDSLMYSSYDKMPAFVRLNITVPEPYNIMAVLPLMKAGDSAVMIQMMDTLMKLSGETPAKGKKGDKVLTTIHVLEVYKSDSIAMTDYQKAAEKDRPRQEKEREDQMAKAMKEQDAQIAQADEAMEKSGEIGKELKAIEEYLQQKKISAQKTGKGTYVAMTEKGSGPDALPGKYVHVKYVGKFLSSDSTFQTSTYEFPLGKKSVIRGWDEGLLLFKQGGKGTLYVPGFLAYGPNPPQNSPFKPNQALKFDIELLNVSDTPTVRRSARY